MTLRGGTGSSLQVTSLSVARCIPHYLMEPLVWETQLFKLECHSLFHYFSSCFIRFPFFFPFFFPFSPAVTRSNINIITNVVFKAGFILSQWCLGANCGLSVITLVTKSSSIVPSRTLSRLSVCKVVPRGIFVSGSLHLCF